jgi:hypothetical protein
MFCGSCGTKREEGGKFCAVCGAGFDASSNANNVRGNAGYNQTPSNTQPHMQHSAGQNYTRPDSHNVSRRQHNNKKLIIIASVVGVAVVLITVLIISVSGVGYRDENNSEGFVSNNVQANNSVSETATRQRRNTTTYVNGRGFSDGVAWALSEEEIWHCIDIGGNIVLRLSNSESPASDFSLGVALVRRADNTLELIDKNGNIISSPKTEDYDRIVDFIPPFGMVKVYKRVETFEVTENRAGIIDNQGLWQTPLTNDYALVNGQYIGDGFYTNWARISSQTIFDMRTMKEGIESAPVPLSSGGEDGYFFNIISGNSFIISGLTYRGEQRMIHNTGRMGLMENKKGVLHAFFSGVDSWGSSVSGSGSIYSVNSEGQTHELFSAWDGGGHYRFYVGEYSEGIFYFSDGGQEYVTGFYDLYGDLIIDLSGLTIRDMDRVYRDHSEAPRAIYFEDGYCLLVVYNPQGTRFFTIIDRTGKQMFEPRFVSRTDNHNLTLSNGLVVINNIDGTFSVINTSGEAIVELNGVSNVSNFSDGIAMVTTNDGEIYYIDKVGQRLF